MAGGDDSWRSLARPLLLPAWGVIGVFALVPVLLMAIYSFLTKEFRGGVEWDFTLAAYDQFFVTRGLFGDEPAQLEWTYITIFWRSLWQAALCTGLCLAIGFPTAWFIATRPPATRGVWLFLITIPYWVNLLIRTVSLKFLIRDNGPLNESLMSLGLISDPLPLVNTNLAVQLGLFYSYLPFMVLPIYAAVERYNFALSEAAAWLALPRHWGLTLPGGAVGGAHAGYKVYPCKDGRVAVAALEPHFAAALCAAAGVPMASLMTLFAPATHAAIAAFLLTQTCKQLDRLGVEKDIPLHTMGG